MISGYLSLNSGTKNNWFDSFSLREEGLEDIESAIINTGSFKGEYLLHHCLPWTCSDMYHYDELSDMLILISGAIYNAGQLKREKNFPPSLSTPAFVASLFLSEGPGFVDRLNGDFAIFLYRPRKKEAYLFRDHVGIRPLAWSVRGQEFLFSSDIIGLCRTLSDDHSTPARYLAGYFKYVDNRSTPNPGVRRLLPGHYLKFTERGAKLIKYWHPETVRLNRALTFERMISELGVLLNDAVEIRCDNRFKAGAHISSGLDSGIVSVLAREGYVHQNRFCGFSWSPRDYYPGEIAYDERGLVKETCEKAGIEPHFSEMVPEDLVKSFSSLYGSPSLIYEGATLTSAGQTGTNLIFSGWGGDEFISTGDRGVYVDLLRRLRLRAFFRRNPVRKLKLFIWVQLHWTLYPALGILDPGVKRAFRDDARYLKRGFRKSDRRALATFYFHRSRRQAHLNMLQFYHLQKRCEEWMINGYRRGIEYRYPLLDKRIIEYMLSVPSELLVRTKYPRPVLRELGKGILPEAVRMNVSKVDPVSQAYTWKMYKEAALLAESGVEAWKADPSLSFINFDLLTEDMKKYHADPTGSDNRVLFKGLVYIKAVYEFAKQYERRS